MDRLTLLEYCKKKCNNQALTDTGDFALVLTQLIEIFERVGIVSESISDLSQSFNVDTNKDITLLLSPYRKARFI